MRPLIPRVRVGDILKGTRNLRNYLQTAATLNCAHFVRDGLMSRGRSKKNLDAIFRPSKNERFLVTVNSWGVLGVCSLDSEVVLLFSNPYLPPRPPNARRNFAPTALSTPKRMDPTIFSQWFIRTTAKKTNLNEWPDYPYHMWASLHLNLVSIQGDTAPAFHWQEGPTGPFYSRSQSYGVLSREKLRWLLESWVSRGITRPSVSIGRARPSDGFGPTLEDTVRMRLEIEDLCSNPRIAQGLEKVVDYKLTL